MSSRDNRMYPNNHFTLNGDLLRDTVASQGQKPKERRAPFPSAQSHTCRLILRCRDKHGVEGRMQTTKLTHTSVRLGESSRLFLFRLQNA
eukprot:scaffold245152_cov27-Prasinocladus_malaysianus.AAC.1